MSELSEEFYLDEYAEKVQKNKSEKKKAIDITKNKETRFYNICDAIKKHFQAEWEEEYKDKSRSKEADNLSVILERQKKAIIGYDNEVNFFKDKIKEYLSDNNLSSEWYPEWYKNLIDGIYQENWGLAGISEWVEMKNSSSAKIIGNRIYFMIDGRQVLQKQTISNERYNQLRKALLLKTPKMRLDKNYSEVYMLDGTRITIYDKGLTMEGQESIVFRKYIVNNYTFEEQAKKGTIPMESVKMFKSMARIGFNVAFTGPVRTAKTTFLQTWQSYEDQTLEGILIQTDPEIQIHLLMPEAPIIPIIADGEELANIVKSLMRSDADYMIVAEARDGVALYIAVKAANKGTRRVKLTYHNYDSIDFCYDIAEEIVKIYGGSLYSTIVKVSKSFNYIFQFVQLQDKSKKRLKAIYEVRYDNIKHKVTIHQICKYRYKTDDWVFKYDIGEDKRIIGEEENQEDFDLFEEELKRLSEMYPMEENNVFYPEYDHLRGGA